MIITVDEAKKYIQFPQTWTDEKIERKLLAVEQTIRAYTNNNFQDRGFRTTADVLEDGRFYCADALPFSVGDTIQVSESKLNAGLVVVDAVDEDAKLFTASGDFHAEAAVLLTKVKYPADVVDCVVNLLEWEVNNRHKVGIKSETLSRHSVTYFDLDANNQVFGYPASLLGVLKSYKKARF